MKAIGFIGAITLALCSFVVRADEPQQDERSLPQVVIHFADRGGIINWQADGDSAIFIEGEHRHWFHAQLMFPCNGLRLDDRRVGFESEPDGDFDNLSFITLGHQRCQVSSLVAATKPKGASN